MIYGMDILILNLQNLKLLHNFQPLVGDIIVDEVLGGTAEIVFIKDSLTMLGFM